MPRILSALLVGFAAISLLGANCGSEREVAFVSPPNGTLGVARFPVISVAFTKSLS